MGLLDFDDKEIMKGRNLPTDRNWRDRRRAENELEENFAALQNLGRKENSENFSDSPFADRTPEQREDDLAAVIMGLADELTK